jgi:hypothetical protein
MRQQRIPSVADGTPAHRRSPRRAFGTTAHTAPEPRAASARSQRAGRPAPEDAAGERDHSQDGGKGGQNHRTRTPHGRVAYRHGLRASELCSLRWSASDRFAKFWKDVWREPLEVGQRSSSRGSLAATGFPRSPLDRPKDTHSVARIDRSEIAEKSCGMVQIAAPAGIQRNRRSGGSMRAKLSHIRVPGHGASPSSQALRGISQAAERVCDPHHYSALFAAIA